MSWQPRAARLAVPVSAHDHRRGPDDAAITLVEYGDFECSSCGEAYPVVQALWGDLGEQLRFVFRNFPLESVHPHAVDAAIAAEAAALQGKFWEMHNLLFRNQDALEPEDLWRYGEVLGLDMDRFQDDFQGSECRERVRHDFLGGARSGVNGTPTFFINGLRHNGGYDYPSLSEALQAAVGGAF